MEDHDFIKEIKRLKKEKNAVILAHNYQIPEIQDIADIVGDSLKLSQEAAKTDADMIVFCGVHFMAESAKILSPNKKVILPVRDAGCPMADMVTADDIRSLKKVHPGVPVICYVNTSAEVKAECDIAVTSSNALRIVKGLGVKKVLFVPDKNLGDYINNQLDDVEVISWKGYCITHERVNPEEVLKVREAKPNVKILVHPECNPSIVELADFVGSTAEIISFVKNSEDKTFIIGTEMGILHSLRSENPDKSFKLLSPSLICYNMKKTTLENVYHALKEEAFEIRLDEEMREKAFLSLNRMIELS